MGVDGQARVLDPVVHGGEQREQPVPGGGGVLQLVLRALPRPLLQLRAQPAGRVRLRVQLVVAGQQPPFLGEQQEHHAHHHRHRTAVDLVCGDVAQALALDSEVGPADRGHQQLDGLANLHAEGLGEVFLAVFAALPQRREALGVGHPEEPAALQQRAERPHHVAVGCLRPGHGVEHRDRRHVAARRADQRPPAAVGHQAERDVVVAAQLRHPIDRGRRPRRPRDPGGGLLPRVAQQTQQPHVRRLDLAGARTGLGA